MRVVTRCSLAPAPACCGWTRRLSCETSMRRSRSCARRSRRKRRNKSENPASGAGFSVSLSLIVGAGRFELPTSRTRTERATKLRYAPKGGGGQWSEGFDLSRMRRRVRAIFVQSGDEAGAVAWPRSETGPRRCFVLSQTENRVRIRTRFSAHETAPAADALGSGGSGGSAGVTSPLRALLQLADQGGDRGE